LSYAEFSPGSAELQAGATKKLERLIKGLYERPALAVEIEGSVDPKSDGERLHQQQAADLGQLARRRAERVKEHLLQVGKVEAERVFLAEESGAKVVAKGCRAYIHLR
jgi:flagellar motor protein MotB